jgi:hypothetical protein
LLNLEIRRSKWHAVNEGFDCQPGWLNCCLTIHDVVGQGKDNVVFESITQIICAELFANVTKGLKRGQSDVWVFTCRVLAEVWHQIIPFFSWNFNGSNLGQKNCDTASDQTFWRSKSRQDCSFDIGLELSVKLNPVIVVCVIL